MSLVNPNRNQAQQSSSIEDSVKKYYITFGQSSPFRKSWVEVNAEDEAEARQYANDCIGKWSMCYTVEPSKLNFPGGRIGLIVDADY